MASVNKQSLREEFGALKDRFGRLRNDGKVTEESRALFEALLMLLQVLMAVFMEKNTPKNSTNSSKPASQTPKDNTAVTQSGTHGKGKVLNETGSGNTRAVESQQISPVSFCEEYGEDLHKVPCEGYQTTHPDRHRLREGRHAHRCRDQTVWMGMKNRAILGIGAV